MSAITERRRIFGITVPNFGAMRGETRIYLSCVAIFLLTLAVLLVGIEQPAKLYFDEVHYVPAARELLNGSTYTNAEHPPLAKELMAVGISLLGDDPLGWRCMSAVFGALAMVAIYLWSFALFRREGTAWWVAAVTFSNQVLYVQSRIAMLDIFLITFMLGALAAFTATWIPAPVARTRRLLLVTGIFLGLAIACKWVGVLAWLLIVAIVVVIKVLQSWQTRFADPTDTDWYRGDLWPGIGRGRWIVCLAVVPLAVYYATFLPLGWSHLLPDDFFNTQVTIWRDNATLGGTHPYMSSWIGWPVLARPIWYFFEGSKWGTLSGSARAVLFLGNPVVYWTGLAGVAACLYGWFAQRNRTAFLIFASYSALYLGWALIPRRLEFSFYYLPAAMVLGPALAYLFYRTRLGRWPWIRYAFLAASLVMFGYFLPVSNAGVRVSESGYSQTMWFEGWR